MFGTTPVLGRDTEEICFFHSFKYISIYDSTIYDEKSTINFDNLDFIEGRES